MATTLFVTGTDTGTGKTRVACALLSARAIAADTQLVGWVANTLAPMQPRLEDHLACLDAAMPAPRVVRAMLDPPGDLAIDPRAWLTTRAPAER